MDAELTSESDLPSKTQLKQEATDLQRLGGKLTTYSPAVLRKLCIPEVVISAIAEFNRLPNSHGARRRQLQFIGKLMRDLDYDAVNQSISDLESGHLKKKKKPSPAASWGDRILQTGDSEITAIVNLYPTLERQTLRQLCREYNRAKESSRDKFRIKLQNYLQQHLHD